MNILAIIPARGGSKGIHKKNITPLKGRPLIAWTIESAIKAHVFQDVIVSTDDKEIASVAQDCGATIPFLRPDTIAHDTATGLDVIRHTLNTYATKGHMPEAIAYLQPTSPFRTQKHILEALHLFSETNADVVVSVMKTPHSMTPDSLMQLQEDNRLLPLYPQGSLDRHTKPKLYARNGPAILLLRATYALHCSSLYEGRVYGFEMDMLSSWDIDTPEDLKLAEALSVLSE